jgi:hypothetical protein
MRQTWWGALLPNFAFSHVIAATTLPTTRLTRGVRRPCVSLQIGTELLAVAMVDPTATVITVPANEVEPSRKKIQRKKGKGHQGGPCESNRALFAYCDFFPSFPF